MANETTEIKDYVSSRRLQLFKELQDQSIKAKQDAQDAKITEIEQTADTAKTTAETAKQTAEGAVQTANGANTKAENAVETANDAKSTAESAVETANTANTTANAAKTESSEAKTSAANANTVANEASTTAATAKATADQTKADLETLSTKVSGIESDLADTQGDVEDLQSDVGELQSKITGLTGAMHYVGRSTTDPKVGPTIKDKTEFEAGDVTLWDGKEYVYDGTIWEEFGREGDHITGTEVDNLIKAEQEARASLKTELEGKITANTNNISKNASAIEKNANDIASNATAIGENKTAISDLETQVAEDIEAAKQEANDYTDIKIAEVNEAIDSLIECTEKTIQDMFSGEGLTLLGKPLTANTEAEMDALIVEQNEGAVAKYTGETGKYEQDTLYSIEVK